MWCMYVHVKHISPSIGNQHPPDNEIIDCSSESQLLNSVFPFSFLMYADIPGMPALQMAPKNTTRFSKDPRDNLLRRLESNSMLHSIPMLMFQLLTIRQLLPPLCKVSTFQTIFPALPVTENVSFQFKQVQVLGIFTCKQLKIYLFSLLCWERRAPIIKRIMLSWINNILFQLSIIIYMHAIQNKN